MELRYFIHPDQIASMSPDQVGEVTRRRVELEDLFPTHDCHASPEDGCSACAEWFTYREEERYLRSRGLLPDEINGDG
jgi:hypothetical protein